MGVVTAAVTIAACVSLSPHLSSTEQDSVVVNPTSFDFGAVQVGKTSGTHAITVSPAAGIQNDTITSITSCAQFPLSNFTLPAQVFHQCTMGSGSGSTCTDQIQTFTFTASFAPSFQQLQSCTIVITLLSGQQTVTLQGTGTAPDHLAAVTPTSIDFQTIRRGSVSGAEGIMVHNAGAAGLDISSVTLSDTANFAVTAGNQGAHTIGLGLTDTYSVVCMPQDTNPHTATVTIASDDAASPAVVTLTCTGIDSTIGVDPSPANVSTRVGTAVDFTMTISNTGAAPSTLDSVGLSADASPELTITNITTMSLAAVTGTSTVTLHYAALTDHPQGPLGTLNVLHDSSPTVFPAAITGNARLVTIMTQPSAIDFGPVCLDQQVDQVVAVYAAADGEFTINSFAQPAAPFSVTYNGPTMPIANPQRANDIPFTVSVKPTMAGDFTSTAPVVTDAPGSNATYQLPLKVHALPAGVTATPTTADFGVVDVDTTSDGQMIALTNCSSGPINFTAAHIDGADSASFALVSPSQVSGTSLGTAMSAQFIVVMSPHVIGSKQAQLVIEYDSGTAMIELDGDVTGGDNSDGTLKPTYYSCSAGVPATLIPVGLALGLILRRRRRK